MGERKTSAHLDPFEWVEKMCVKNALLFFLCVPSFFSLHFLPSSLFGRELDRNCEVDLHTLKRSVSRVSLSLSRKEKARGDEGEEEEEDDDDTYEERLATTTKRRSSTRRRTKEEFLENDETKERKGKWVPTFIARSRSDGGRHKRR